MPKESNLFPADMRLITHWGLRDELKSNYVGATGLEKQQMIIYDVMKSVSSIRAFHNSVINSGEFTWDPKANKIYSRMAKKQHLLPSLIRDTPYCLITLKRFKSY
jgi:hypothetical protein